MNTSSTPDTSHSVANLLWCAHCGGKFWAAGTASGVRYRCRPSAKRAAKAPGHPSVVGVREDELVPLILQALQDALGEAGINALITEAVQADLATSPGGSREICGIEEEIAASRAEQQALQLLASGSNELNEYTERFIETARRIAILETRRARVATVDVIHPSIDRLEARLIASAVALQDYATRPTLLRFRTMLISLPMRVAFDHRSGSVKLALSQ